MFKKIYVISDDTVYEYLYAVAILHLRASTFHRLGAFYHASEIR